MKKQIKTNVEAKVEEWKEKGKSREETTWGMMCEGFRSISGIPDDFQSAEDPTDRVRLWEALLPYKRRDSDYDPLYKD